MTQASAVFKLAISPRIENVIKTKSNFFRDTSNVSSTLMNASKHKAGSRNNSNLFSQAKGKVMVKVDDLSKNVLLDSDDRAKSMLKQNEGEIRMANQIQPLAQDQPLVFNNFSIIPFGGSVYTHGEPGSA